MYIISFAGDNSEMKNIALQNVNCQLTVASLCPPFNLNIRFN